MVEISYVEMKINFCDCWLPVSYKNVKKRENTNYLAHP